MPDVALTDAKERVRQAIDIVDLVGSYLSLRREGRSYKALCPWHNDRRPSMTVNPERQIFRCWVCNIGGDIFNFVMRMEGLEFPEALALLAERAGIPLERSGGSGAAEDRKLLLQAAAWVEHEYHLCLLRDPAAEGARKYLAERGVHSESIRRFHLGFAPDQWNWLQARAKETSYSPQVLERIGVLSSSQRGWYERFKGRVLFSIRDPQGRPVALGGRILPGNTDDRAAKYVNSPESPLFSKSNLLYGLDAARDALSQSRTALVMEGYTDCIIAQQCGFHNALAVLGTALGPRHLQLLRRFVDRIVLVLDGDEAGRRRTDEILQLFIAEQADLRVLTLPNDLDPCDFLLQHGREAFERLLAGAVDALEHKFQTATRAAALDSGTHAENRALEEILGTLAKAPRLPSAGGDSSARIKEEQILNRLSHRFGVSEPTLRERLKALRRKEERSVPAGAAAEPPPTDPLAGLEPLDREWLEALLRDPAGLAHLPQPLPPSRLAHALLRTVYSRSLELAAAGVQPDFARLLLEFSQPEIQQLLVALDESATAKAEAGVRTDLATVAAAFARRQEDFECRAQAAVLREKRIDAQQEVAILEQIVARSRLRHGISKSTEG